MTNNLQPISKAERLSALIDNESEAFASRRLFDELLRSEADRHQWARYHLIGDCLRGNVKQVAPSGFLANIQAGIADAEPLHAPTAPSGMPRWLKPVAGLGIAAAVATVSLVGLQMLDTVVPMGSGSSVSVVNATADHHPGASMVSVAPPALASPGYLTSELAFAAESMAADPALKGNPDPRFAPYLENHAELFTPGSSAFARVRNSVASE